MVNGKRPKNYDKKIFRLLYLLNLLDRGKRVGTQALSEEFRVSRRSVQRDVELLSMTGFPLALRDDGTYSFEEGFSLRKSTLTPEEASLLPFFLDLSRSFGPAFEDSFKSILRKVLNPGDASPYYVKIPEGLKLSKDTPFLRELEQAVREKRQVRISYTKVPGQTESFVLSPLRIIFFDGVWYLLANPDGKKWLLKFRLEKIKALSLLRERFSAPANLDEILRQSVNIYFSERTATKVLLEASKDVARYFKERNRLSFQKILKEKKDGTLLLESRISDHEEIIPVILSWVPNLKVLSPQSLKVTVKSRLKAYLSES